MEAAMLVLGEDPFRRQHPQQAMNGAGMQVEGLGQFNGGVGMPFDVVGDARLHHQGDCACQLYLPGDVKNPAGGRHGLAHGVSPLRCCCAPSRTNR